MALAWAKKGGTPYVEDPVFMANFLADFGAVLEIEPSLSLAEVDFGPAWKVVSAERRAKAAMTAEERKALAAQRKARREELRERYGYAVVNGERVEVANYVVEPSGIFMGRGKHPLRGRWKEGAKQSDITLNLSPDAPIPPGHWAEVVWQPESLWLARWEDRLSGKLKYVWLSDTAMVKQEREARKFDGAARLAAELERVRTHIEAAMSAPEPKRRQIATACYLIDKLCLRVGDEKDPDEADTIGATTLRPEHVRLHPDGRAEFRFLGKDSVLWHKTLQLGELAHRNLEELMRNARPSNSSKNGKRHPTHDKPQLFPDVTSRDINSFLSEAVPDLSAKVFRTHHATEVVSSSLETAKVGTDDPEYLKWKAASLANLEAAVLCNHTKKGSASWPRRKARMRERVDQREKLLEKHRQEVKASREALTALREEAREKLAATDSPKVKERAKASYDKKIARAEARLQAARQREERAADALGKLKAQMLVASKNRSWNLGTSLKSYIDPRIYHRWGKRVGYDVLESYYPSTLRRKFAWVKREEEQG